MLSTLKATLSPAGVITFDEALRITRPVPVLVTLLEEASEPKVAGSTGRASVDEFLKHRLKRPDGIPPVTLENMEQAIIRGALDGNL
jgi:hypothetical protein